MPRCNKILLVLASLLVAPLSGRAEFIDHFDGEEIKGWFTMSGDGQATVEFVPMKGFARMQIDGSRDPHNVWWTLIKQDVSSHLDLQKLKDPAYELRVEARVRASHAPRRVNFMVNTQRTTDFHEHLREYDISDTTSWHTISMTTKNLDAVPGDTVFVQLAATDWGQGKYHLDVDYYRAAIVRVDEAGPDQGEPLVYHPPVPEVTSFAHHLPVAHDSVIHADYPEVNFNDWRVGGKQQSQRTLSIASRQAAILRWDFTAFRGKKADGAGILELTTSAVAKGGDYVKPFGEDLGVEFGKLRVIEILEGDPAWDQNSVTYASLLRGGDEADVFNGQMTTDIEITEEAGGKSFATLPRPVMQRLLEGRTKGIILRPLGAIVVSLSALEQQPDQAPTLHFNLRGE